MTSPDLSGRTYVVTGANSGIGLEAAKKLSAAVGTSYSLFVTLRRARSRRTLPGPGTCEVRELDLASLASVRAFAEEWGTRRSRRWSTTRGS